MTKPTMLLWGLLLIQTALCLFNGLRFWGNYLYSKGEVAEAAFIDPGNYLYRYAAGTALLRANRTALAVAELKRATELNPAHLDAWNNFAVALIFEKRYSEAHEVLLKTKAKAPGNDHTIQNLEMVEKLLRQSSERKMRR